MADAPATKKVSKIESGHAKNVANLGVLITAVCFPAIVLCQK